MENLVSHEAMVKEIKNLCWDNRYREGMTVEHLAEELDALAEDFDPYEYRDNLLDEDNYIDEIIYDLNDGRYINEYMEFLQMVAEEDEDNSIVAEIDTDIIDDCHEYLILHFKDGTERLFCNSYVDLFIS